MFVRSTGAPVRDPVTKRHLPAAGREVPETSYWLRRLQCGDVVLVTPLAPEIPVVIPVISDSDSETLESVPPFEFEEP